MTDIVFAVLGLGLLVLGRKLFWLFVGAVGFAAGLQAAQILFGPEPFWALWAAGLVGGIVGALLAPAGKRDILIRMLVNLKRAYVRLHSFPQAHAVTELLVALDPAALGELRDRGLLASHLRDYASALRDLEAWLQLAGAPADDEERETRTQVWDHVKTLRRRLASLN